MPQGFFLKRSPASTLPWYKQSIFHAKLNLLKYKNFNQFYCVDLSTIFDTSYDHSEEEIKELFFASPRGEGFDDLSLEYICTLKLYNLVDTFIHFIMPYLCATRDIGGSYFRSARSFRRIRTVSTIIQISRIRMAEPIKTVRRLEDAPSTPSCLLQLIIL